MVRPIVEEASRQLGIDPDVIRLLLANAALGPRLLEEDRLSRAPAASESAAGQPKSDDASANGHIVDESLDYVQALREAFERGGNERSGSAGDVSQGDGGDVSNPEFRRERVRDEIGESKSAEPRRQERFDRVPRRVWEARDGAVRQFLIEQYEGRCQICAGVFARRDGAPYFEGLYLVSRTRARWIDRPGNIICLCATCCAKFQHGPVDAPDVIEQINAWRAVREGGNGSAFLILSLCHEVVRLAFTEKHMLDLQEIVRAEIGLVE